MLRASDRHFIDEQRATANSAPYVLVRADRRNSPVEISQIAGDRDLVHGILDLPVLDPLANNAAGLVTRNGIYALADQFLDDETRAHCRDQLVPAARITGHDQVLRAARICCRLEPQPARRIAA